MRRFIAQTGLGDAIFALPLALAHEYEKIEAEFYTAWPELLDGLRYVKGFKVPAWPTEENLKFDGVRLKYDRYRGSYFVSYYMAHVMKTDLVEAQKMAQHRLSDLADPYELTQAAYVVAGTPRLPARHKEKKIRGDEGDPVAFYAEISEAQKQGFSVVSVGKDEIYTTPFSGDIDLTDKLTLVQLIDVVQGARYVISQVGFLTALAGCLGVPVNFISGAREPLNRFYQHVNGVTWKKNLRA